MEKPGCQQVSFASQKATAFTALSLALWLVIPAWIASAATPAEQYQSLVKEHQQAQEEFSKLYQAAKTDAERQQLKYPQAEDFAPRFLTLARNHAGDPAAADALIWVGTNVRTGTSLDEALGILFKEHLQNEKLGQVCQSLVYASSDKAEKFLRGVAEKSPHHEAQGWARFSLGQLLKYQAEMVLHLNRESDARQIERLESYHGKETVQKLLASNPQELSGEAGKLFEEVAAKSGDIKGSRGTLADAAKGELFEMRNLAIGKVAPDLEGTDVDGKKFRLSDYRGKVVVIDFWGDW